MYRALHRLGLARITLMVLSLSIVIAVLIFFQRNLGRGFSDDEFSLDLSGSWEFHNGPLSLSEARNFDFTETVTVPRPLPEEIRSKLQNEFWYRKTFSVPSNVAASSDALALYLGSIKGVYEVFWNGASLGSRGKNLALFQIPEGMLKEGPVTVLVRVKKIKHLFPGIVHHHKVQVARASMLEWHETRFFFESGAKPLIAAAFKISLFFLFSLMFISVPKKREFFSYALCVLSFGIASAMYSQFMPFYFDFYLRNWIIFIFSTIGFCCVPLMTADFLRLKNSTRQLLALYGFSISFVLITASFLVKQDDNMILLFREANSWVPILTTVPALLLSLWSIFHLPASLLHRKVQIGIFTFFLGSGALFWIDSTSAFFKFQNFIFPDLIDMGVLAGLALSMALEFRHSFAHGQRAGRVVPKWFQPFLVGGAQKVVLDLPLVAMAVDTVSYTKKLSELNVDEKKKLHERMRYYLSSVVDVFEAQKLSDRGDGALFAWNFYGTEEEKLSNLNQAVQAANFLISAQEEEAGIQFRIGISLGEVRCEMNGSEFSFLGEPLNSASRLEGLAKPGSALIHESVLKWLRPTQHHSDWVEAEVKGVIYRAKKLDKTLSA